ncbi:MAG: hypothetical protein ACUVR8_06195 [Acidobacteriota bacterium]
MSDRPTTDLPGSWGRFLHRQGAFVVILSGWLGLLLTGLQASFAGQPVMSPVAMGLINTAGQPLDGLPAASPGGWLVVLLTLAASLVSLAVAALVFWFSLRARQKLESEISTLQACLRRLEAPPSSGGAEKVTSETALRTQLTALQSDLQALRQEVDYLKNKLSMLLVSPETPPHPLPALSSGMATPQVAVATGAPPMPVAPAQGFENQRVSDLIARYRGRLRAGHVDALTQHFSSNPSGLFLELEEQGERFLFPAQEVIYAGDFQQNYSFVYDCDQPGSGYVVVVKPAQLDARGQVTTRGRLRIE